MNSDYNFIQKQEDYMWNGRRAGRPHSLGGASFHSIHLPLVWSCSIAKCQAQWEQLIRVQVFTAAFGDTVISTVSQGERN